jgi:hypothetical protein
MPEQHMLINQQGTTGYRQGRHLVRGPGRPKQNEPLWATAHRLVESGGQACGPGIIAKQPTGGSRAEASTTPGLVVRLKTGSGWAWVVPFHG